MRTSKQEPWKLSYTQKKHVSYKFRETEREILKCKQAEDWQCVKRLKSLLRRKWWGVKRYKK